MTDDVGGNRNEVRGPVTGIVVQAGLLQGGVHFHQVGHTPVTPRQLPSTVPHFVGRHAEVDMLTNSLDKAAAGAETVVISAINGTAGIGKTTLAVHWAHQAADRFPDGQLYVNLRGFDPTGTPMQPGEAMREFLDAFEVPPERIPVTFDAQAALYRSLLAGRRMLIVLDNARDAEQVRPLLPGSSTCLVVVTSRNRLTGLIADGAQSVTLDVLRFEEATALFAYYLGEERVGAESDAVAELIERCARLPLALAITAARAAANPKFPLNVLIEELQDEHQRLGAFDIGDLGKNVRAVFSWSYRILPPQAAHLFRILGLHPGPDISRHAAASLVGVPDQQVRALLAELTRVHMLDEHIPGRYRFHDLLRDYASERAINEEPELEQSAAIHRSLGYYLHTGVVADSILDPLQYPISLDAPPPGVVASEITDHKQAHEWFTAEHAVLLAATNYAVNEGLDTYAWQLPWILSNYLDRRGHWHDFAVTQQIALAAANRLGDRAAQARTHRNLGYAYSQLRRHREARSHLEQALTLWQELSDLGGQAFTYDALGWAYERQSRHAEALIQAQHAVDLYRTLGRRAEEAHALSHLSWNHARLGNDHEVITDGPQTLAVLRELGDRHGEAHVLDSLGYTAYHLGRHEQAIKHYQQTSTLYRELGDYYNEADALHHLGDACRAKGDHSAAQDAWQRALTIFDQLAHLDAGMVRTKLTELEPDSE